MKTSNKLFCCLSFALLLGTSAEAQFFKKLAKKIEELQLGCSLQTLYRTTKAYFVIKLA